MTIQVNIAEAKAKLSELVARAENGEEVIIARHGKPIVTLTVKPSAPTSALVDGKRRLGVWEHLNLKIDPELFLRPDPDLEAAADGPVFLKNEAAHRHPCIHLGDDKHRSSVAQSNIFALRPDQ